MKEEKQARKEHSKRNVCEPHISTVQYRTQGASTHMGSKSHQILASVALLEHNV